MKQFTALLTFLLLSLANYAQGIEIEIPGLSGQNASFEATSVQMITTSPSNSGRRGAASGGTRYLVMRPTDQVSSAIQNASLKGRFFKSAVIYLPLADGSMSIRKLDKVYISEYNASFGGNNAGEQFYMNFHTEEVHTK